MHINNGYAQNDISFILSQVRKNYFALKINSDSLAFEKYVQKALKEQKDTFSLVSNITNYFNDPHLIISYPFSKIDKDSVSSVKLKSFAKEPIKNTRFAKQMTGFWINDLSSQIVFVRFEKLSSSYKGYIFRSFNNRYLGRLAFEFSEIDNPDSLITVYFVEYGFKQMTKVNWINSDFFQISHYSRWKKVKEKTNIDTIALTSKSDSASAEEVNDSTILFKIPLCSKSNTLIVDSLTNFYKKKLETTKTLILDLRNNPGGDPGVYRSLMPYIHTNTVFRGVGNRFVSDELLAYEKRYLSRALDSVKSPQAYEDQKKLIKELEINLNSLYEFKGKTFFLETGIVKGPKRVFVLANYACMSATEMMLIDMRQSKKVTIFGEQTAGATDNLNYFPIQFPSKKYILYIPSVRIIPTKFYSHYEKTGIKPDVEISPYNKNWVDFILRYEKI